MKPEVVEVSMENGTFIYWADVVYFMITIVLFARYPPNLFIERHTSLDPAMPPVVNRAG